VGSEEADGEEEGRDLSSPRAASRLGLRRIDSASVSFVVVPLGDEVGEEPPISFETDKLIT
jgi:hypothetical protein